MVKCPECGEILTENDKTCPSCGKSLSNKPKVSSNKIIAIVAIVVVIAIVGVLASGMFSGDNTAADVSQDSKSVEPIKENVSSDSSSSGGATEYWASAKAEKFHKPTCEWAEKISEDNKIIYQSREDAIADGKVPCGVCNP